MLILCCDSLPSSHFWFTGIVILVSLFRGKSIVMLISRSQTLKEGRQSFLLLLQSCCRSRQVDAVVSHCIHKIQRFTTAFVVHCVEFCCSPYRMFILRTATVNMLDRGGLEP